MAATISASEVIESVTRGATKRNRYRYTLNDGTVHERRSWVPVATDNTADLNARGAALLDELVTTEVEQLLGGT